MLATTQSPNAYASRHPPPSTPPADLLRAPGLGRLLRRRWFRRAVQTLLLLVALVMVLHGLMGPDLAPKNLATLLSWVHFRGVLVLVLLLAGNFFCFGCPFMLPRDLLRRVVRPRRTWPRALRNKWLAVGLFVLILYAYELFSLWGEPRWTAWLIVGYFVAPLLIDGLFRHASFCKWVCPIGQFNFVASLLSPLEVGIRDPGVCSRCRTKDCIRGRPEPTADAGPESSGRIPLPVVSQRGCELALFQPMKVGNMDCTFCMDCVHACPHDNVGIVGRLPGAELWTDTPRSGVGRFADRRDVAALVIVFTFGALLNAFGMVRPVYALQAWLSGVLGTTQRGPILGLLFVAGLVVLPALLLGPAAWLTVRGSNKRLLDVGVRYAFTLVPLGLGVWLAHYSFHFLTGVLTIVPVSQNALVELGWPVLGEPNWGLTGLREGAVYPMELGFLGLGLVGSWLVAVRLARQDRPASPWPAALPWMAVHALLWAAAVWLLSQPMEMRGTFLGG